MQSIQNGSSSTEKQETVIKQFMHRYEQDKGDYDRIAKESAERLKQALTEAGVPHRVESRAKDVDRLRIKINGRKAVQKYEKVDDIVTDVVDLAGVRVLVYFASDKKRVEHFINANFHLKPKTSGIATNENAEAPYQYVPKYLGYCADHYRATLKLEEGKEVEPWEELRVEIQVMTILRHTWAEVGHDWNYKQLVPGGDDEFCHQLLDALSGAMEMGEFFLEKMQQRLVAHKEEDDRPFKSQYDLGMFLTKWAAGKAPELVKLVDVQTLWEVLQLFDSHQPTKLRRILNRLEFSPEPQSAYSQLALKYNPLPLNIETYIIHSIMESDGRDKLQDRADAANPAKRQWYRLKVVRDCFIWFGRLFRFNHKWFALLISGYHQERLVENMDWLVKQSRKERDPLSLRDERILDDLYRMFADHDQLAVQYVFFLSRLRVKTFPADGYAMRSVIEPLLELRTL